MNSNPSKNIRNLRTYLVQAFQCCILAFSLVFSTAVSHKPPEKYLGSIAELNKSITCLQSMLYHEARSEGIRGMTAVLSVVYNRVNHKNYPSTYCGVIKQKNQFSYLNGAKNVRKPTYKPSEHKVKGIIEDLAFRASTGAFQPVLEPEFLFYHTVDLKNKPKWSKDSKKRAIIGNHIFIGD